MEGKGGKGLWGRNQLPSITFIIFCRGAWRILVTAGDSSHPLKSPMTPSVRMPQSPRTVSMSVCTWHDTQ